MTVAAPLRLSRKPQWLFAGGLLIICALLIAGLYARAGLYGFNAILRRGPTFWITVAPDDPLLSSSMRLALRDRISPVTTGHFEWRPAGNGFDVGELPVRMRDIEVDRLLLARIDPAHFRFLVRTAPAGNMDLGDWMKKLGAALVVNGSYYSPHGAPETPLVSDRTQLGPLMYDARHGAFVASSSYVGIRNLNDEDWREVLRGTDDALVSYPLLFDANGASRVSADDRWLANRSFIAQDSMGRIVVGTTTDGFFSLNRLAGFLAKNPLGLTRALNLDGGPVACQGIAIGDYRRDFCGRWELAARGDKLELLTWMYGSRPWALPIVVAAIPKNS